MDLAKLTRQIEEILPIDGIYAGKMDDKSTWGVHYKQEPTEEQVAAIEALIAEHKVLTLEEFEHNRQAEFYLLDSQAKVLLHLEELAAGAKTTLSADDFKVLAAERKRVRESIIEE